jgi:hypothetical protein
MNAARGTTEGRETITSKPRKAYHTPRLSEFGTVAKLTQGNNGSSADPGLGTKTRRGTCL